MTQITMDSKEITSQYLTPLLKRLAEAIGWACQQKKKITFEVPEEIATQRSGGSCLCYVPPSGRVEAEILIGILKLMGEKGHRRTGPRRRK